MTDQQQQPPPEPVDTAPDPGNADPAEWTGDVYEDDDLDAQVAAATDGANPLDDPNVTPPVEGEVPPGSDPDGARTGEHALAPGTVVDPADVYVPDVDQAAPARGAGGKFVGKQQPEQTVEGA